MATIQKRGKFWRVQIRRKGYPPQSSTFDTKRDAEAWARMIERQMETGKWRDTSAADRTSLGEALDRYIRDIAPRKKGKGLTNNKSQANVIKRHPIAKIALSRIRAADVATYVDKRSEEVSANTLRLELALMSHLFTVAAAEWGMEGLTNPVKASRKPSVKGTARDRRLQPGEEERLIEACKQVGPWWLPGVVRLAIETGMRRGEIADLEYRHIDLNRRVIHLPTSKTNEARDVPLSSRAIDTLESLPRHLDGKVFPVLPAQISKRFARACAATQPEPIEDLRFHDLRHEATSRFFELGLNPMQVAAITGHKTLQMLKRYTHLKAEDLAKMLG